MTHRQLKARVLELLQSSDLASALNEMRRFAPRQVVNPLFGLLYHGEPRVRWHAVTAMGAVVSGLADEQIESARIIMRRFMWNLNDESGGIGWGSPEAMGEIMARHPGLACEYGCILVSYANPDGNFLEHPGLQAGLLWAFGRLGRVRPEVVCQAVAFIKPYLQSPDPNLKGLAVWALEPFADEQLCLMLQPLLQDNRHILIYVDNELVDCAISMLAGRFFTGQ